ncbi:MAG: DUF1801 domain-containing protein [Gemmatimonas sp.]
MLSVPSNADTLAVDAFFATLDHPHVAALQALRRIILGASPDIHEGIKWKVPSFRTTEYFATMHLRAKQGVGVILHFGAKKRDSLAARASIADPATLLHWLADDRAVVAFRDAADVEVKREAFVAVVRQWIPYV